MSQTKQVAIIGIGATEFSKNSGRSEMQLACEAALSAVQDAGIHGRVLQNIISICGLKQRVLKVCK